MTGKICVFTSTHLENDIRIFKKQIICLLNNGLEVIYYTNKDNLDVKMKYKKDLESYTNPNLKVHYNGNYYENKRFLRLLKSLFFVLYLPRDCSVYHFHDPDLLFTGLALKILGKKVIYDVHENYGDSIRDKEYLPQAFRRVISLTVSLFETFSGRFFDTIICATPSIEQRFLKSGIKKTIVINNYPFKSEFSFNSNADSHNEKRIIYAGGVTNKRGISQVIKSLEQVNERLSVKLIIAGEIYPAEYESTIRSLAGWKYVKYLGLLSRSSLKEELKNAVAGVVLFLPERNHINAQPNKIFEYMSAGLPVICSNFPLWKQIVEVNKCGVCVDPEKTEEIAAGILSIVSDETRAHNMGKRGKKVVEEIYNWESEEIKFISVYKDILENN